MPYFVVSSMRRLVIVFVMSLYSLGSVFFPNIDMAHLYETYKHCETEDPDLNVADFVFEHLLNIPEFFDGRGQDDDKNEKPHQPIHLTSLSQVAILISKPISFECRNAMLNDRTIAYSAFRDQHLPAGYSVKMLRPPIA